jgi:hypothetical protein
MAVPHLVHDQDIPRKSGGKTVVRVYECDDDCTIVTHHTVDAKGVEGTKTCTCSCTSGGKTYTASKTCKSTSNPSCDCSTPTSPKVTC